MIRVFAAILLFLSVAAAAAVDVAYGQHYHDGYVSPGGYSYRGGYWYYGGGSQAYTRTYIAPYYSGNYYYGGYYQYTPYYPPHSYAAPAATYQDAEAALLKIAADREKHKQFLEKVKALGLEGQVQSPYAPAYGYGTPGYGYYGHLYNYTLPVNATTTYGYSYSQLVSKLYGDDSAGLLFQQSAQLTAGAQKLHSDALLGFQNTVNLQGEQRARVAEIIARGAAAVEVAKALGPPAAAQFKGYSFSATPPGTPPKDDGTLAPARQAVINKLAELVSARCASCHTGAKPKGGFDISLYLVADAKTKAEVWRRISMRPEDPEYQAKMMPRDAKTGGPGIPLTADELRLFEEVRLMESGPSQPQGGRELQRNSGR